MKMSDYFGDRELHAALKAMREHAARFDALDDATPFEVDASFESAQFGPASARISLAKVDSPYHRNQCFEILMVLKIPQFGVESTLSIGEAARILGFLDEMRDGAAVKALLADTFRNLDQLGDRSGMP